MFNVILKVFLFIINTFYTLLLTPINAILLVAFPSIGIAISYIISFFDIGFTYFVFFLKLFMVPSVPVVLYLSLVAAILTFNITIRVYSIVMSAYHYFKL